MIISDLTHCQSMTSDSGISGAGRHRPHYSWGGSSRVVSTKVYQKVDAYAVAINFGKGGSAIAFNETYQSVSISN